MTEEQTKNDKIKDCFIRGNIAEAIALMKSIPEMNGIVKKYIDIFENEQYIRYDIPEELDSILLCYQKYFRDVFYCLTPEEKAACSLLERLRKLLHLPGADEEQLTEHMQKLFEKNGYHVLFGDTQGYYGPYVWKETVPTSYSVELPDGTEKYTVNILRGFVFRSWMDYLTFGEHGTGGWASKDGVINCVEKAYDFESEAFQNSFLKHEAQHAVDIKTYPGITAADLEYRAKLVELIYGHEPELLQKFISEADEHRENDGHAMASARIKKEMEELVSAEIPLIQARAKILFEASNYELRKMRSIK